MFFFFLQSRFPCLEVMLQRLTFFELQAQLFHSAQPCAETIWGCTINKLPPFLFTFTVLLILCRNCNTIHSCFIVLQVWCIINIEISVSPSTVTEWSGVFPYVFCFCNDAPKCAYGFVILCSVLFCTTHPVRVDCHLHFGERQFSFGNDRGT